VDFSITDARVEHIPMIEKIEQECFSVPWTKHMLINQLYGEGHIILAALRGEEVADIRE
jgi:hypothetical protein